MSKKTKLLNKLRAIPRPTDFPWDDLVTLMRGHGFTESCDGGSHYSFQHEDTGFTFTASKTHPSGVLKTYQIKDALNALLQVGAIED